MSPRHPRVAPAGGRGPRLPAACLETASSRGSGLEPWKSPWMWGLETSGSCLLGAMHSREPREISPGTALLLRTRLRGVTKAPQLTGRRKLDPSHDGPGLGQEALVPDALSSQRRCLSTWADKPQSSPFQTRLPCPSLLARILALVQTTPFPSGGRACSHNQPGCRGGRAHGQLKGRVPCPGSHPF